MVTEEYQIYEYDQYSGVLCNGVNQSLEQVDQVRESRIHAAEREERKTAN